MRSIALEEEGKTSIKAKRFVDDLPFGYLLGRLFFSSSLFRCALTVVFLILVSLFFWNIKQKGRKIVFRRKNRNAFNGIEEACRHADSPRLVDYETGQHLLYSQPRDVVTTPVEFYQNTFVLGRLASMTVI